MRKFILGLGAQKTGTTWLFKQLIKSDQFTRVFSKEYHLFDALHLEGERAAMELVSRRINNYPFHNGSDFVEKHERIMKSFYESPQNYFDYFDNILNDNCFTLDITPSYAGLSREILSDIRDQFSRRGIALKVVFLMREPICRVESSVKMNLKRSKTIRQTSIGEMTQKMYAAINSSSDLARSNYGDTCRKIDEVFDSEDVFYGFYETLFTPVEVQRLSQFLELESGLFDAQEKINSSAKLFSYCATDMEAFRAKVSDRYDFVSERFNFDTSIWRQATDRLTAIS